MLASHGWRPQTIMYRVAPRLHTSLGGPLSCTVFDERISGAMNAGVPFGTVRLSTSFRKQAVPKSQILTVALSFVRRTFWGFRSLWMIPISCMWSTARRICRTYFRAVAMSRGVAPASLSASGMISPPSHSSWTMYSAGADASSITSWRDTMFSCRRMRIASISRRSSSAWLSPYFFRLPALGAWRLITFIAYCAPLAMSSTRLTFPKLPCPSSFFTL